MAALGGLAVASWVVCLRAYLLGPEPGPGRVGSGMPGPGSFVVGWGTALLGVAAAGLTALPVAPAGVSSRWFWRRCSVFSV